MESSACPRGRHPSFHLEREIEKRSGGQQAGSHGWLPPWWVSRIEGRGLTLLQRAWNAVGHSDYFHSIDCHQSSFLNTKKWLFHILKCNIVFDVEVSLTHDHQRTRQVHFYSFPEVIGLKPLHEIERTHCTSYYLANQLPEQESIFGEWMTAIQGFPH